VVEKVAVASKCQPEAASRAPRELLDAERAFLAQDQIELPARGEVHGVELAAPSPCLV